jgi:hypothetical protein
VIVRGVRRFRAEENYLHLAEMLVVASNAWAVTLVGANAALSLAPALIPVVCDRSTGGGAGVLSGTPDHRGPGAEADDTDRCERSSQPQIGADDDLS